MRTKALCLLAIGALIVAAPAAAEIGTLDQVPAATLLLPYFEVNFDAATMTGGPNTIMTITNASASAMLARVTLWTDLGVPTYAFDVYLTGYDVEYVDLRLLFLGIPPVTADDQVDTTDRVSHQGALSQDLNYPPNLGPPIPTCNGLLTRLSATGVTGLRNAHTGQASSLLGGNCGGSSWGDSLARGFVTVDSVKECSPFDPLAPNWAGYFASIADGRNALYGEYWIVSNARNFAWGDALTAIEASTTDPRTDGAGDYTFYSHLIGSSGADHREGLPTVWMGRFVNGGVFTAGTSATVWREAWPRSPFACGSPPAPLGRAGVAAFDEQENPSWPSPPAAFPLAAERVRLADPARIALQPAFGNMYYDLKLPGAVANQSLVTHAFEAEGRFATGFTVWSLDNVSAPYTNSQLSIQPECGDLIDNDGDGFTDYPADAACSSVNSTWEGPPCHDGIDNDGDGKTDYPADPGCRSATWNSETGGTCDDQSDNDGDGKTDYPDDPGCKNGWSGGGIENPQCLDGIDNDLDGQTDYPADAACTTPYITNEGPACNDGDDNDGDGKTDYPADPGCQSVTSNTEAPACLDGADNDLDGLTDYPADPGCQTQFSNNEAPACNNGADNDFDGLIDMADPGCQFPYSTTESPICHDGFDSDGDGLVDFPNDPGCQFGYSAKENPQCNNGWDDDGDGLFDFPADPQCSAGWDDSEGS
jgi:hypothetical protein